MSHFELQARRYVEEAYERTINLLTEKRADIEMVRDSSYFVFVGLLVPNIYLNVFTE